MKRFNNIHNAEIGQEKAPLLGYPDMGNGRYSVDLDYGQWFSFNNWQRVHYNFLEQLTPTLIWIAISALYKPLVAAIFGFVYFVGRILYSIRYCRSPN